MFGKFYILGTLSSKKYFRIACLLWHWLYFSLRTFILILSGLKLMIVMERNNFSQRGSRTWMFMGMDLFFLLIVKNIHKFLQDFFIFNIHARIHVLVVFLELLFCFVWRMVFGYWLILIIIGRRRDRIIFPFVWRLVVVIFFNLFCGTFVISIQWCFCFFLTALNVRLE